MLKLHLEYIRADKRDESKADNGITIAHFPFVIGRQSDCDCCLSDPWISRRHCSFFLRDGEVWVTDLGSRNGTYLNGQLVKSSQPIHEGDWLALYRVLFEARLSGLPEVTSAPRDANAEATGTGKPTHNVLVVEDDVDVAQTLASLLKHWGHEVHVVYDGPEAIRAAQAHQPDTVFLDLRLPRMDGYQVAEQLRAQVGLKKTKVVAITGDQSEEYRGRPQKVGIDRLLIKPVDVETLQEVLNQPR